MKLTWTKDLPTHEGIYWAERPTDKCRMVYEVYPWDGHLCCEGYAVDDKIWRGFRWAGPIPYPDEPKE